MISLSLNQQPSTSGTQESLEQLTESFQVLEQEILQLMAQADGHHTLDITHLQSQLAAITCKLKSLSPSEKLKSRLNAFDGQLSDLIEKFSRKTQDIQKSLMEQDQRHRGIQAYSQNQKGHFRVAKK